MVGSSLLVTASGLVILSLARPATPYPVILLAQTLMGLGIGALASQLEQISDDEFWALARQQAQKEAEQATTAANRSAPGRW